MMNSKRRPLVSFVLATHNRKDVVTDTLMRIAQCGLDARDYQVVVVDNASQDGTPEAVADKVDVLVRLDHNAGSCAKALVVDRATAPYVIFLDDDSAPRAGSVARMLERFEADPQLGAAGFTIHLPDGRQEASALPGVFHGCGVGLRIEALNEVGGLDPTFVMQAEEYDLSFRLVSAGWSIEVFGDLHVDHLKTPHARRADRITYFDVRNNLRLAARYLPSPYHRIYRGDWFRRYAWLAARNHQVKAFLRGAQAGLWRSIMERRTHRVQRLKPGPLESFFRWGYVGTHMASLAREGIRRVVFADLGKNIYAFYQAAKQAGIDVLAIGDDHFCAPGRRYRGIALLPLNAALDQRPEAVVVSNTATVFAARTFREVSRQTEKPIYNWFEPPRTPL